MHNYSTTHGGMSLAILEKAIVTLEEEFLALASKNLPLLLEVLKGRLTGLRRLVQANTLSTNHDNSIPFGHDELWRQHTKNVRTNEYPLVKSFTKVKN